MFNFSNLKFNQFDQNHNLKNLIECYHVSFLCYFLNSKKSFFLNLNYHFQKNPNFITYLHKFPLRFKFTYDKFLLFNLYYLSIINQSLNLLTLIILLLQHLNHFNMNILILLLISLISLHGLDYVKIFKNIITESTHQILMQIASLSI